MMRGRQAQHSILQINGENIMTHTGKILFAALLGSVAFASAARAEMIVGLSGDKTLTSFDSKTLKTGKKVDISGVNGRVVGIDMRPSDGLLYAVTVDGTVYTVNADTGAATLKIKLEKMLAADVKAIVDFNPAADRLRLMGSDGMSLRANLEDGKVTVDGSHKYADGDKGAGKKPNVIAGAYSNSVKGTKETTLYNIDGALGTFLKQAPPNDGVLGTLGATGIKGDVIAFDISTDAAGKNTGFALAGGTLYTVDIATGASTAVGKVAGLPDAVRDIAVIAP
jgi:outer membrane protein assembly factor BamB